MAQAAQEVSISDQFLSCGARLFTRYIPGATMTYVRIVIDGAGSGNAILHGHTTGIAHFHEHLSCGNPKGYVPGTMVETAKQLGSEVGATTGYDSMTYLLKTPTRNWNLMSDLATAMCCRSAISEEAVENEKGIIDDEKRTRAVKQPVSELFVRMMPLAYQDDRLFFDILGAKEDVLTTGLHDSLMYCEQFFNAERTIVVVEGGIPNDQVVKKLEERFSLPKLPIYSDPAAHMKTGDKRWKNSWEGALCSLLFPVPISCDIKDHVSYNLFSHFLFGNMLFKLRARLGRVYVFSNNIYRERTNGQSHCSFITAPEKVEAALDVIGQTLSDLAQRGTPNGIRDFVREYEAGFAERKWDAYDGASDIMFQLRMFGRYHSAFDYRDAGHTVTNEDIMRHAQEMLSGPHFFGAMGNLKGLPKRNEIRALLQMSKKPNHHPI